MGLKENARLMGFEAAVDVPRVRVVRESDNMPLLDGFYAVYLAKSPREDGSVDPAAVHHFVLRNDDATAPDTPRDMTVYELKEGERVELVDTPLHRVADVLGVDCHGRSEDEIAGLCIQAIRFFRGADMVAEHQQRMIDEWHALKAGEGGRS